MLDRSNLVAPVSVRRTSRVLSVGSQRAALVACGVLMVSLLACGGQPGIHTETAKHGDGGRAETAPLPVNDRCTNFGNVGAYVIVFNEPEHRFQYPPHDPLEHQEIILCIQEARPGSRYRVTVGSRPVKQEALPNTVTFGFALGSPSSTALRSASVRYENTPDCESLEANSERQRTCGRVRDQVIRLYEVVTKVADFRDRIANSIVDAVATLRGPPAKNEDSRLRAAQALTFGCRSDRDARMRGN
jgi:hypothetical protein